MEKTKGRILCVEDDEDTRDMLSALLGLEGYEVVEARNVTQGLTLATSSTFDLISVPPAVKVVARKSDDEVEARKVGARGPTWTNCTTSVALRPSIISTLPLHLA